MRLNARELEGYTLDLIALVERYGIDVDFPATDRAIVEESDAGERGLVITGALPGSAGKRSFVGISELWSPVGSDAFERSSYLYELIDQQRGYRRAFHRHDDTHFQRTYGVVVHEHCESPLGHSPCPHFFGQPIRDGFRAIELLMATWVGEPPNCAALPCLEEI